MVSLILQGGVIRTTEAAFKHLAKNQGGKGGDIVITSSKSGLTYKFMNSVFINIYFPRRTNSS